MTLAKSAVARPPTSCSQVGRGKARKGGRSGRGTTLMLTCWNRATEKLHLRDWVVGCDGWSYFNVHSKPVTNLFSASDAPLPTIGTACHLRAARILREPFENGKRLMHQSGRDSRLMILPKSCALIARGAEYAWFAINQQVRLPFKKKQMLPNPRSLPLMANRMIRFPGTRYKG